LRSVVLEDLKVVARQPFDDAAVFLGVRVDDDEVGAAAEGLALRRLLRRERRRRGDREQERRPDSDTSRTHDGPRGAGKDQSRTF